MPLEQNPEASEECQKERMERMQMRDQLLDEQKGTWFSKMLNELGAGAILESKQMKKDLVILLLRRAWESEMESRVRPRRGCRIESGRRCR